MSEGKNAFQFKLRQPSTISSKEPYHPQANGG